MTTKKEKTKEERIKTEIARIKRVLKEAEVDENKVKALEGIIKRASFLMVACEEFEVYLLENGHTEPFQQSPNLPPYNKIRAEATLYANSFKDYKNACKQITDTFAENTSKVNVNVMSDGFDDFVESK